MTPDDLAAIRARVAGFMPLQLSGYMGYTLTRADALDLAVERDTLVRDRRALLAALDEANAECARSKAEVDRLTAANSEMFGDNLCLGDALASAVPAERARIRAEVGGLRDPVDSDGRTMVGVLDRADVLRIIDGGEA